MSSTKQIGGFKALGAQVISAVLLVVLALSTFAGCASQGAGSAGAGSAGASASGEAVKLAPIKLGSLATEDILPIWVAQDSGIFSSLGLTVEVVKFQSATELIAGITSGDVDVAMTDIMVTASIFASGTPVQMEWVTLGTTPAQGRFGIMVGPNSNIKDVKELANVPIGVGSNTILEYVMDRLLENAGIPANEIKVEELQKLPVRFQAMLSGEVAAAALPSSLLALGEAQGAKVIAEDTTGENISQSVMIARSDALSKPGMAASMEKLKEAWDIAATKINEDPAQYRSTLVKNANLSDAVANSYPVPEYPVCQLPTSAMVDPVLNWMTQKGYLKTPLKYNEKTGEFSK